MMKIDLRSDTVTRPTKEMIECMMSAEVGDDVYKEDSSVNLLEKTLAEMFGMEMALYFPTGTMANQTAIKLLTRPGDEIIADHWSHKPVPFQSITGIGDPFELVEDETGQGIKFLFLIL